MPDEIDVADTLIDIARERRAAVVVVGSHGITGLRTRLLGSVSRKVIEAGLQGQAPPIRCCCVSGKPG